MHTFTVQFIPVVCNTEVIVDGHRGERSVKQVVPWISDLLKLVVQILVVIRHQFFEQTVSLTEERCLSFKPFRVGLGRGSQTSPRNQCLAVYGTDYIRGTRVPSLSTFVLFVGSLGFGSTVLRCNEPSVYPVVKPLVSFSDKGI